MVFKNTDNVFKAYTRQYQKQHQTPKKSLTYHPHYNSLFSYNEEISHNDDGVFIIYNKTAKGGKYFSKTTSQQVGKFIKYCKENYIEYIICNYRKIPKIDNIQELLLENTNLCEDVISIIDDFSKYPNEYKWIDENNNIHENPYKTNSFY
jgi:hypothetical protein